ncbi:MAG: succinate dehydrogenase cytochrome b subunit [Gemmataceae bacterium]
MSTSTAINPKGHRLVPSGTGAWNWFDTYLASTVGQKIVTALTGLSLVGFVIGHLIGNLKIFEGPEALNAYAYFLKHKLGVLIWIARGGLLAIFTLHILIVLRLKLRSSMARPVGYAYQRSAQATPASKTMIWTGLVVGAFVVFHLAHFTFAWLHAVEGTNGSYTSYLDLKDAQGYHDVYRMVIVGFQNPVLAGLYLIAQAMLFIHLSHGIASAFSTLGIVGRRFTPAIRALGIGISGAIFLGNSSIVLAVLCGIIQ